MLIVSLLKTLSVILNHGPFYSVSFASFGLGVRRGLYDRMVLDRAAQQMKKLFLTSSVNLVAKDIAKRLDLTSKNKLVFITTAAEPETGDKTWLKDDRQSLVDAGFKVTDYTITDKNLDQLKKDLMTYDYIYLSGGNTLYLLRQSRKSGFYSLIKDLVYKNGKTYIGTSAGSIITGPKIPDYLLERDDVPGVENQEGYGFVDFTVVPHWGSEFFRDDYLKGRMEIAYRKDQVPLVILTDNQYICIQDDKLKFIDVSK
jgi:dipeptidase E